MNPNLLGGWPVYLAFILLANVVGVAVALRVGASAGIRPRRLLPPLLVLMVAALAGAKLYSILERGSVLPLSQEAMAGYRFPGAAAAVLLLVAGGGRRIFFFGQSPRLVADMIAPSFGTGTAVIRVGCFLTGCCSGTRTNLPWGVKFPRGSETWYRQVSNGWIGSNALESLAVHPLQLYLGLLCLLLGGLAWWFQRRKACDGQVFLAYLSAHAFGKFLLEFLRADHAYRVQSLSLGVAVAAGTLLLLGAPSEGLDALPVVSRSGRR
jgi:phosphatidylglycerol:prolipoprotein diacylglycerol transferase